MDGVERLKSVTSVCLWEGSDGRHKVAYLIAVVRFHPAQQLYFSYVYFILVSLTLLNARSVGKHIQWGKVFTLALPVKVGRFFKRYHYCLTK